MLWVERRFEFCLYNLLKCFKLNTGSSSSFEQNMKAFWEVQHDSWTYRRVKTKLIDRTDYEQWRCIWHNWIIEGSFLQWSLEAKSSGFSLQQLVSSVEWFLDIRRVKQSLQIEWDQEWYHRNGLITSTTSRLTKMAPSCFSKLPYWNLASSLLTKENK